MNEEDKRKTEEVLKMTRWEAYEAGWRDGRRALLDYLQEKTNVTFDHIKQ